MGPFDDFLPIGVVTAVAIATAIAIYLILLVRSRKRTEALQRFAEELGFGFVPVGGESEVNCLKDFQLYWLGRAQRITNLVRGVCERREVNLFDYHYVTGHGKNKRTTHVTVIHFLFDAAELPGFMLQPEGIWHKIGSWYGKHDIDFHTHPAFSSRYLLRGNVEPAVRSLFADEVLEYYEQHPGLTTQGSGHALLYYRHGRTVPADELRAFLADGMQVLSLFLRTAQATEKQIAK